VDQVFRRYHFRDQDRLARFGRPGDRAKTQAFATLA
jgi:hypothetical protein